MKVVLKGLLVGVLSAIGVFPTAHAASVEAVQLDYLSPDASLNCNRIFFTSSQQFKGVVYAVPIVVPEINENNEEVGSVVPNHNAPEGSDKKYLFKFNIFFPRDEMSMKDKLAPFDASRAQSCTFAAVKNSYNKNHPDSPIETITDMPLTSFEVTVPDYAAETVKIGKDADVTTYADQSFTIALPITEKEKISLFEALSNDQSVQAKIKMKFKGRSRDGSIKIEFSTSELAMNFKLAASGAKMMTRAEINAAIKVAISKTQINIQTQSSSEEFFQKAAEEVLNKVISQIDLQSKSITDSSDNSSDDKTGSDDEKISVEIVANLLAKVDNRNIQMDNTTAPEEATIDVMMSLKPRMEDPSVMLVRVAAGEEEGSLSTTIDKDHTIRIIPAFGTLLRYGHKEYETYLNKEQLTEKRYSNFMSALTTDSNFTIRDIDRNGTTLAVGSWGWKSVRYWFTEYVWKRVESWPELIGNQVVKANTDFDEFSRYPICVTFTNIGQQRKMIPLYKLVGNNEYFHGRYDEFTGEIVLTAKKDLGMMMFRSRFLLGDNNDANDLELTGRDREMLASCLGQVANRENSAQVAKDTGAFARLGSTELRNSYNEKQWDYQKTSIDAEVIYEIQRGWGSVSYEEEYVSLSCSRLDPANKNNHTNYPQCFDKNKKLLTCASANVSKNRSRNHPPSVPGCLDKDNKVIEQVLPLTFPSKEQYVLADQSPFRKEVIRKDRKAYLVKQVVYYSVSRPVVDQDELKMIHQIGVVHVEAPRGAINDPAMVPEPLQDSGY